jgi:hypothetical protein
VNLEDSTETKRKKKKIVMYPEGKKEENTISSPSM